jgi:hypothetical protein
MSKPIYKFFMARFSEAWYQLSEEKQNSLIAKVNEALEKVGAKRLILCNSSWSSEQWKFAGAEEFPNIEAVQNQTAALEELNGFDTARVRPCWALKWNRNRAFARNVIASFRVAQDLGFKSDFRGWEELLRLKS